MLNLLLRIKFLLERSTEAKPKEERGLLSKIILNGLKLLDTYILFFYLKLLNALKLIKVKPLIDDEKSPIVSLTSYPARFKNLWMVIYSIYNQTVLPAKIVITLIKDEVPNGLEALPNTLRYFSNKGVEFLFCEENLKPHNKYYYSRQKYPDRDIITIDDDQMYYPDTIERLMVLHKSYPDAVCANRGSQIILQNGEITNYGNWMFAKSIGPSLGLLALGYGAVFYPSTFCHKYLYDKELIKELCLDADDLWLMAMETLSGTEVVIGDYYAHPVTIPSSQKKALRKTNTGRERRNDKYLELLEQHFQISKKINRLQ